MTGDGGLPDLSYGRRDRDGGARPGRAATGSWAL